MLGFDVHATLKKFLLTVNIYSLSKETSMGESFNDSPSSIGSCPQKITTSCYPITGFPFPNYIPLWIRMTDLTFLFLKGTIVITQQYSFFITALQQYLSQTLKTTTIDKKQFLLQQARSTGIFILSKKDCYAATTS
jgi:hypothetical protein